MCTYKDFNFRAIFDLLFHFFCFCFFVLFCQMILLASQVNWGMRLGVVYFVGFIATWSLGRHVHLLKLLFLTSQTYVNEVAWLDTAKKWGKSWSKNGNSLQKEGFKWTGTGHVLMTTGKELFLAIAEYLIHFGYKRSLLLASSPQIKVTAFLKVSFKVS